MEEKKIPVIRVKNLYKIYQVGTNKVYALNGVDFTMYRGEFCAIVGPSGSGKSTLLNMLAGLEKPTKGEIIIAGKHMERMNENQLVQFRRENVGFIFQSYNLLQEHTAWENIAMPYILDGKRVDQKRLNEVCSTLEIEKLLHKYPVQLSGGEQQRIAIARAMIHNPSIIFADEPTGNLDPQTAGTTVALLKKVVKQFGTTLVLVTHDMEIAAESQETIRIEEGQIVGN